METLSSCYFCGVALDEPLAEYPVVPPEFREGEATTTATLCPACHRKLETILEEVVAAAGETPQTDAAATSLSPATAESTTAEEADDQSDTSSAETASEEPEGSSVGLADADDLLTDPEQQTPAGTDEEFDETSEGADDSDDVTTEDIEAMAGDLDPSIAEDESGETAEDDGLADAMEPDVPDELQAGDDEGHDFENEDATEPGQEDEPETVDEAENDDFGMADDTESEGDEFESESDEFETAAAEAERDDSETAVDAENDESESDDSEAEESPVARTSVSALEYNKVMRLLQNREFPVDREEIEAVAASAYELGETECAEVIDLAIDRGLIDEEGGKLIRP